MEIFHRVETLLHFIERARRADTPSRMTWVVMIIDESGRIVSKPEREAILASLGIKTRTSNEVDVYDWF